MKRHRLMDLQPPPSPIFRHQYHHHHHLRYDHVLLHPPNFIPQSTHINFPPPPPPPQLRQSHILLLPPRLHIAQPPPFNQSPLRPHPYETDLLPYPHHNRNFLLPPPPENIDRQFHRGKNNRGRDNRINDFGRGLNGQRDYGEKICERIVKKMDYDVTRRGSIDGWIRGLNKDKDKNRDYNERRRGSGIVSEEQFVRSKKRRLQKETAISRVQSGKDYFSRDKRGHEESRGGSFLRGKEKEGFECLKTRLDDKKASEAILASPCSDNVKIDINRTIKPDEAVVKAADLSADGAWGTSKELLVKVVVSESGTVGDDAKGSGEIDVKDQPHKNMKLQQGPTVVESVRRRRNRLKRKRKARKKLLRKTNMQVGRGSCDIANADDCIIIPSASSPPQPFSDANDLVEIAMENQPQKDTTLHNLHAVSASQSVRRKKCKARKKLLQEISPQMRNDSCRITNANNDCHLDFNQHDAGVDKFVSKEAPTVFDTKKSKTESVDQYARLGTDRVVDDFSEHPLHSGLPLEESSFLTGSAELLDKAVVSESVAVGDDANGSGEIDVKDQSNKDMKLQQAPTVVESGSRRRNRLKRERKARKKLLHKTNMQMGKGSGDIANQDDCIIIPSASFPPHPFSDTNNDLVEIAVENQPQKDANLHNLHVVCAARSVRRKKWKARKKLLQGNSLQMRNDSCRITNANSDCRFGFNQHVADVGKFVSKEASVVFDTEKSRIESVDQYSRLGTDRVVDDISEHPLHNGLLLEESSFHNGSADSSPNINSTRKPPGEVERPLAKDLVPVTEVDFLSFKDVYNSNEGLSRVEDSTLELDSDANGYSPSYSKKRKVASPRSNISSFLEDEMVTDRLNGDCPKLCQVSTKLAEWEAEKRDNPSFSRNNVANEMICGGENISNRKYVTPDLSLAPFHKSLPNAASDNSQINTKLVCSLPEATSEVLQKLNPVQGKQTLGKNQLISASPKVFPGHHPLDFGNSKKPQATNVVKSRTWHRTGNSSSVTVAKTKSPPSPLPPQSHGTKTAQSFRSSYIRKGNSLVRNPSSSAVKSGFHNSSSLVYRLNPGTGLKTNQESNTHASSLLITELVNTSETPCKAIDASEERLKAPGVVSEFRADSANIATSPSTLEEGSSEKKVSYVKRRSNQLVAASNSDDMPVSAPDKSISSSSNGYYKSNKNQLVRASPENPVKKRDANGNSRRLVPRTILPRTCTKRPSKVSFVWKLHDMHPSEKKASVRPQKVLPHVPWKRTTSWRTLMHALSIKPNRSSFSIVSQSLLPSRKRGAIYTRSTHGYSLKMSKVLSVGGSSLKWSKSIERNSKKADEEATRAVAAAGERKKEENCAIKSRNNVSRKSVLSIKLHPGERIFRIGSERYKMDPSRRTLHRITAEQEQPSSVVVQSEKNVKRSYVPRRLLIGNEEYVRIGNGNQLVRDPKKRIRVLASEKVRWSLRTARLRLARKRKYCQFFTRFGKCNKDDGKCPYIHDPSKIAVCTKFLNGLCTNVDCKLTHKVIPERMEDCSYFLKGSCSNEKCPYRHVNVKSESGVCKNFLKGYCADGNECLKKHTYVCPSFEATGSCPKASTCKLHHPKKKIEKKQLAVEQKIVKGRYFDGGLIGDTDVSDNSTELVSRKGNDDVVTRDRKFPDYISLDVSDEEDSDDMVSDDFDVLV